MGRAAMLAGLVAALAASSCGGGGPAVGAPAGSPNGSPSGTAPVTSSSRETLFAVLESRGSPPGRGREAPHDTVAIVGRDGTARAKAFFAPRSAPNVGNARPTLLPEAMVAPTAHAVVYVDAGGVLRSLAPRAQPRELGTLPGAAGSQREIDIAVSADGSEVLATVIAFPAPTPGQNGFALLAGTIHDSVVLVRDGSAHLQRTVDAPAEQGRALKVVGWDSTGPLALPSGEIGTQDGLPGQLWFGAVAHVDTSGNVVGEMLGGSDCSAQQVAADGSVLCGLSGGDVAVRSASGQTSYAATLDRCGGVPALALSPDSAHLACGSALIGRDRSVTTLPAGFVPQGWLDARTVIGRSTALSRGAAGNIGTVSVDMPTRFADLGFAGDFVGLVQA